MSVEPRIVQIHPTLRCNLRCLHCYSASGPERVEELSAPMLCDLLRGARAEGYNVVSTSGGEPLLYGPLPEVLGYARELGMFTSVTTNGTLLHAARLDRLRPVLDLLAISLDGLGAAHNQMRGAPRAFESLVKGLDAVRATGLPFGFITTLTMRNAGDLDAIARFAVGQGASLLQIHPLEAIGHARRNLPGEEPDERELTYTFLEVARIQREYADRLTVQFDVVDRDVARTDPDRVYATDPLPDPAGRPLAELLTQVVLEADGIVVPIQYGFAREYAVADLNREAFPAGAARWKSDTYARFLAVCRRTHAELLAAGTPVTPFANWYDLVRRASAVPASAG